MRPQWRHISHDLLTEPETICLSSLDDTVSVVSTSPRPISYGSASEYFELRKAKLPTTSDQVTNDRNLS